MIGAFVGRDARTARRWEAERGLPVHRVPGGGSASVWADSNELAVWMKGAGRDEAPEPIAPTRSRKPFWIGALAAAGLVLIAPLVSRGLGRTEIQASMPLPYGNDRAANETLKLANSFKAKRTVQGLFRAEALFTQLQREHPENATAFVGEAETNLLLREFNSLPQETAYRRAQIAATKALEIDPKSPTAMRALAFVKYWNNGDRAEGLKLFEAAIAASPADPQSYHWYGTALLGEGRPADAQRALDEASRLNPDSSAIVADRAYAHYLFGDRKGAITSLTELIDADPEFIGGHAYLERMYLIEGNMPAYLREAEATARLKQQDARLKSVTVAAAAFRKGGKPAMLASLIGDEMTRFKQDGSGALRLAILHVAAGDRAQVLHWLGKAESVREPDVRALGAYIEFMSFRGDPAFKRYFAKP